MGFILLLVISFILTFTFFGPTYAIVVAGIQIWFWFFELRNAPSKKRQIIIEKAYETEKELHPDITDPSVIEKLVCKRLMRKKLKRTGTYFGIAILLFIFFAIFHTSESKLLELISIISLIASSLLQIATVLSFAKSLHDPLTPNEAMELARKDAIEKGDE